MAKAKDGGDYQPTQQTELQRIMLRAQSAETRIGSGIAAGLLDEVVAGAEDFEKHMEATAKVKIHQTDKQDDWKKRALALASNAKELKEAAQAALKKGETEMTDKIVELYAKETSLLAACHRDFREQVRASVKS